jgi:pyruvate-formate lyase-activating enzyme
MGYTDPVFRKLAILSVTSRCNHACVFCSEGDTHDGKVVPLSTVRGMLVELRARGYDSVNFMGAETTLRGDVVELLRMVRELGLQAALTTNGARLASPELARAVVPLLAGVEVSLPAATRDGYRLITGRDHLDRTLQGLRNIGMISRTMERPPAVVINTVVCRLNADAPAEVARLLPQLEPGPFLLLDLIRARGQGRAAGTDLVLDPEQCSSAFREGIRAADTAGVPVMFRGLPTCCLFDEVAHNFATLEMLSRPDYTFLNRGPLDEGTPIDENVGLDRMGRRYPAACRGCTVRALCPGLSEDAPDDPWVGPPSPPPDPAALAATMRGGPVARLMLDREAAHRGAGGDRT